MTIEYQELENFKNKKAKKGFYRAFFCLFYRLEFSYKPSVLVLLLFVAGTAYWIGVGVTGWLFMLATRQAC